MPVKNASIERACEATLAESGISLRIPWVCQTTELLAGFLTTNRAEICYNSSTMTQQHIPPSVFTIPSNQPLIGIPFEENGQEVTRYFSEEAQADQAVSEDATQVALRLAGAWSDLNWEEMEQALDRIRHESKPTPPIDDL